MRIIPAPKRAGGRRREIVPVPDTLRAKALAFDVDTAEAIERATARAQKAEAAVREAFAAHLGREAARVGALVEALGRPKPDAGARANAFRAAHRLRDAALALDAPLVARLAGSLARLLEGDAPVSKKALALARAHADAIAAAERDRTPSDDPVANALARELEAAVTALRRAPPVAPAR